MPTTLAKSLHTVTVLVNVTRIIRGAHPHLSVEGALRCATEGLGYGYAPDPHGLADKALAILAKDSLDPVKAMGLAPKHEAAARAAIAEVGAS